MSFFSRRSAARILVDPEKYTNAHGKENIVSNIVHLKGVNTGVPSSHFEC